MKNDKKFLLLTILHEIKEGKSNKEIVKKLGISKQNLNYYIRQLLKEEKIIRIQRGFYQSKNCTLKAGTTFVKKSKEINAHAFQWKITFPQEIDWPKHLQKVGLLNNCYYVGIKKTTPALFFNNKKIWFTKQGLIIYENKKFKEINSYNGYKMAVIELNDTIKKLGYKLELYLDTFGFSCKREHYAYMKNNIAKYYRNKNQRLSVKDKYGKEWLWVDFSDGDNHLETRNQDDSKNVQDWYNDMRDTDFKVTPSFTLKTFNEIRKTSENIIKTINVQQTEINNLKENKILDINNIKIDPLSIRYII